MTHNRLMLTYAHACGPATVTTCAVIRSKFRKATLASTLAKVGAGIRLNEHLECDDGETVYRHACKMSKATSRNARTRPIAPAVRPTGSSSRTRQCAAIWLAIEVQEAHDARTTGRGSGVGG